jgi:hypothetical protein
VTPTRIACVWACALGALGCRDLSRFDTGPNEAYCGSIVTSPFIRKGFTPEGAPPRLPMRLRLDTDNITTIPGSISTNDGESGLCTPFALFTEAPLRAIEEVFHDDLSFVEFGEGREHNFFAWVDSCQGTVLAVVSLMKSGDVEVRLLKPGLAEPPTPDAGPGFALFVLHRQAGTCGF